MIENDPPETSSEQQRRLRGQRAGKPGEGFAEIIMHIKEASRLSRRLMKLNDYTDNPDQLMLHCPTCDLMNDFTATGQQIFYFEREWTDDRPPHQSTTSKRMAVIRSEDSRVLCKCGNCGGKFECDSSL